MYHFKEYEHNPLVKRDRKRNNISYVDYPKSTMLFHLVPIQSSPGFTEPSPNSNPMFVAYHRILCQAKREKKSSDTCVVRMIHPHKRPIRWTISLKNGYVIYKNNVYRNTEDFHVIRVLFQSLFHCIITLKTRLHRIRTRKRKKKLFLVGTRDTHSCLSQFRYAINAPIRRGIYTYL